jgi:hypothetical protein
MANQALNFDSKEAFLASISTFLLLKLDEQTGLSVKN